MKFPAVAVGFCLLMAGGVVAEEETDAEGELAAENESFEIVGEFPDFGKGDHLGLTLTNRDDVNHTLMVARKADEQEPTTPESVAIAGTDRVAPGGSERINFTVPENASHLYLWCRIGDHEGKGMSLTTVDPGEVHSVDPPPEGENSSEVEEETGGGDTPNHGPGTDGIGVQVPEPSLLGVAAMGLGAWACARRG